MPSLHHHLTALLSGAVVLASAVDIFVASEGGNATSGHQYGFLHEDINNSGDGGIYAELIRNRAFQYSQRYPVTLDGWSPANENSTTLSLNLDDTNPLSMALPVSMKVTPSSEDEEAGFSNDGYWGISVTTEPYTGTFFVRGSYEGEFTASLASAIDDTIFGTTTIPSTSSDDEWTEHTFILAPTVAAPSTNNTFTITFTPSAVRTEDGSLDFNLISLFPPTYKNRPNGLRRDLAETLEEIHPTFFRFPGGNMLEGDRADAPWDWKDTLGPLKERPGFQGVWGYQQTHGLGLMEYLYWAEDMGMHIVVGVWAGLSLDGAITAEEDLQPYIDDALDQIEFIRGPADSVWGSRRAELGHPEPFELLYVEIGNEDWLAGGAEGWQSYQDYRFPLFMAAINEAYPDITVISSGASTDGHDVPSPGMGDYHPYRTPDALVEEFSRFDNDFPHIVGEVAATHPNGGIGWDGNLAAMPWWIGAVGEAVSMIGYERNADRVPGTFYAPVLRHMDRWQWAVTMVQFSADPEMTTRSTSWHIWELLAGHTVEFTLPATGADFGPLYYVAGGNAGGEDSEGGNVVWKGAVYNTTESEPVAVTVTFEGVEEGVKAALTVLTNPGGDPYAFNDPHTGVNVVEKTTTVLVAGEGGVFEFEMEELSVAVLDTDLKEAGGEDDWEGGNGGMAGDHGHGGGKGKGKGRRVRV